MEGVMMRGRQAMATAVRDPEGNIQIEAQRILPPEKKSRFSPRAGCRREAFV